MTDYFKQIFDAWGDRIRSPFFGSVLVAFVAVNWKVLFYLFFADKPVRARILYFDMNSDLTSLVLLPIGLGVIAAIALPWTSYVGAYFARLPKSLLHEIQFTETTRRRIAEYEKRADEEKAIAKFETEKETRQINAAKRLEEASAVSDELKEDLEVERESDRAGKKLELSDDEMNLRFSIKIEIVNALSETEEGIGAYDGERFMLRGEGESLVFSYVQFPKSKSKLRFSFALKSVLAELTNENFIEKIDSDAHRLENDDWQEYQITQYGFYFVDKLRAEGAIG